MYGWLRSNCPGVERAKGKAMREVPLIAIMHSNTAWLDPVQPTLEKEKENERKKKRKKKQREWVWKETKVSQEERKGREMQ
jgi:hypothetical protein